VRYVVSEATMGRIELVQRLHYAPRMLIKCLPNAISPPRAWSCTPATTRREALRAEWRRLNP
jgi:hypothetical protein